METVEEKERRSENIVSTVRDDNSTETTTARGMVRGAQTSAEQRSSVRTVADNTVEKNRPISQQMRVERR